LKDSFEHAVEIAATATHTVLDGLDIHNVGKGLTILGNNSTLTNSLIHDTTMIVATNNNGDDDFGAAAVIISSSNNELAYNRFYNNVELSPDYGVDGAAVEFFHLPLGGQRQKSKRQAEAESRSDACSAPQ
jgi:hypothetical protein